MRYVALMIFCTALAACNTPSIGFRGIDPVKVTLEGSTFDVRVNGTVAEAIRTNMQYAPRLGPIGGRASVAIEQVSGCKVKRFGGDQAVIVAELDCKSGQLSN
ncbi:MAG: hypothetical protein OSA49_05455 [Ascidiaceihabitans sp.]|nr:hypothetical protein [Ascidiaceihabitans sp.]